MDVTTTLNKVTVKTEYPGEKDKIEACYAQQIKEDLLEHLETLNKTLTTDDFQRLRDANIFIIVKNNGKLAAILAADISNDDMGNQIKLKYLSSKTEMLIEILVSTLIEICYKLNMPNIEIPNEKPGQELQYLYRAADKLLFFGHHVVTQKEKASVRLAATNYSQKEA